MKEIENHITILQLLQGEIQVY